MKFADIGYSFFNILIKFDVLYMLFLVNKLTITFAATSVRLYIRSRKVLVFVFLSVWMKHDSGRRYYPILLKLGTNISVLSEIICIVFSVHFPNSACTEKTQKYLNEVYKSISHSCGEKVFKTSFNTTMVYKI